MTLVDKYSLKTCPKLYQKNRREKYTGSILFLSAVTI